LLTTRYLSHPATAPAFKAITGVVAKKEAALFDAASSRNLN
jgi:hypothetical protein